MNATIARSSATDAVASVPFQPRFASRSIAGRRRYNVVAEGVPVTDGVIPYIGNRSITKSGSVCEALRERKARHPDLFEYALHGYTHTQLTEFHGAASSAVSRRTASATASRAGSESSESASG